MKLAGLKGTMNHIEIRRCSEKDTSRLQSIGRKTFVESYAHQNTPENIRKYLEESFDSDKLRNELRDPNSEIYFAFDDRHVIGYLKLNFGCAQTELRDKNSVEIERIYVLKDYQGKKVGQVLCNKALEVARHRKAEFLWLGVWERNPRAISFYRRNGFVEFGKHIFMLGNDEQMDILMRLTLN